MSVIDLVVIGTIIVTIVYFLRMRHHILLGSTRFGLLIIGLGLVTVAVSHFVEFASIHLPTTVLGERPAMAFISDLRLRYSGFITLISIGCISLGLLMNGRGLVRIVQNLRESEERFRDFAEASAEHYWQTDAQHRYDYFSSSHQESSGRSNEALIGQSIQNATDPAFQKQASWQYVLRQVNQRQPFRDVVFERQGVKPDEGIWIRVSGKPYFNDNGEFQGFRGSSTNVTKNRRAEVALHESEKNFRAITEGSPVPLLITRRGDGTILYANPQVGPVLGMLTEALKGRDINEFYVRPGERAMKVALLETEGLVADELIEMRRDDGTPISTIVSFQFINYAGEDAVLSSFQDVTDRMRLEEQLRQAQKMEAVGQLTGGVAHDFNNLMAVMVGNAEFLETFVGDDEKASRAVNAIIRAVDRGASLTHRLLAFSRQQPLSPVVVDVNDLIAGVADMFRRTLGETINLKVHGTQDQWTAMIDPHQFEDALLNLAINAKDAMPDGGMLVIETDNVTLDEAYAKQQQEVVPGDYVEVTMRDTGSGVQADDLEKVFEPFFTTKDVGEGSGLGLSMVYGFVKQSNGHVTIFSEVGEGTTVKLYLPRSSTGNASVAKLVEQKQHERGFERILVVEDDPDVREVLTDILRDQGYNVEEAEDGKAAIQMLNGDQMFDLLFSDIVLSGLMNGFELAEEAKRLRPSIKVLYTTGYAENASVHKGLLDRNTTLVRKPYRRSELLEKVRAMLDKGDA